MTEVPLVGSVLITGATGYIGHRLAAALVGAGRQVHALVRPSSGRDRLPGSAVAHVYDGSADSVRRAVAASAPDTVFHLAAEQAPAGPEALNALVGGNVLMPLQLMAAMAEAGGGHLVTAATYWEYDEAGRFRPNSLYAASKRAALAFAEHFAHHGALRTTALVLYDVYGEDDWRNKILTDWRRRLGTDEPADATPGEQEVSFVHVDDVVRGFLAAAAAPPAGGGEGGGIATFALPAERFVTLREAAALFEAVSGQRLPVRWGARPYPPHQIFRPVRCLPVLPGWRPRVTLEDGIRRMLDRAL
ncbi:NAD(P)-dependent oxidoreductase [Azospirillum sp.]|uniref:NAD-dependent epimerase/dehydratase family protein n=1 Tax=Azospirillum sp. TaxID=34012 RepID=UPI002D4081B5|nr:NAD(P)-dependent oxidoreductase [Azospirillum sp.]HYD63884.1 NAD(P)-dependent oxidoreductase [Azospirillum sp.]